ncbi:MAG: hypothetical protein WED34_01050, partial [Planctomycetales bacterium]
DLRQERMHGRHRPEQPRALKDPRQNYFMNLLLLEIVIQAIVRGCMTHERSKRFVGSFSLSRR